MSRKLILSLAVLAMLANVGQASIFDDLMGRILPHDNRTPSIKQLIPNPEGEFKAFMDTLYSLNTPRGIRNLDAEMEQYKVSSIRVNVDHLPWLDTCKHCQKSFYVVKGTGITSSYSGQVDMSVILSYQQVMRMYPYLADGELDFFDRWQIYAIYKVG